MSPVTLYARWRAEQHEDTRTPSDAALTAFLAGMDIQTAQLDRAPHTATEARMVGRSHAA